MRALTNGELQLLGTMFPLAAAAQSGSISTITIIGHPPVSAPMPVTMPPPPATQPPPAPSPPLPPSTPVQCTPSVGGRVDQGWIQHFENAQGTASPVYTRGNVPSSNSGVTVGFGIDLSWQSAADLTSAGLSSATVLSLHPFLAYPCGKLCGNSLHRGVTGSAAQTALNNFNGAPLITLNDAADLWTMALTRATRTADVQVSGFDTLPAEWQTVLVDLAYNAGSLAGPALPAGFLNAINAGNYAQAAAILATSSNPRYQKDAAQLQKALSGNGTC